MKRILLVPTWYPTKLNPIAGSFFREQALIMMDAGYEFKVIQPHMVYYGVKQMIAFIYNYIFNPKTLVDTHTLFQNPDALLLPIPRNRFLGNWGNRLLQQYSFVKLSNLFLEHWRPDAIHGISYPNGVIYAEKYATLYNKPFALVEHNVFLLHNLAAQQRDLILRAYRNADAVGVVSEHQKKMLLMHEPDCNPITLWNLVDENLFHIEKSNKKSIFKVITVTYPAPIKDYKSFIDSMRELADIDDNFKFIMIGSDAWSNVNDANSNTFEEYAREVGVWHLGEFIPYVSREEMNNYLRESSVFVVTSIAETYGVAAREAMMCGIPVVTTACGGVEDAITPDTGKVAEIRNPKQIALAIQDIRNNITHYDSTKIREYSILNFGRKIFTTRLSAFYESTISKKKQDHSPDIR
jgi:glycosyltransferase involved in cell wall biosynthesis